MQFTLYCIWYGVLQINKSHICTKCSLHLYHDANNNKMGFIDSAFIWQYAWVWRSQKKSLNIGIREKWKMCCICISTYNTKEIVNLNNDFTWCKTSDSFYCVNVCVCCITTDDVPLIRYTHTPVFIFYDDKITTIIENPNYVSVNFECCTMENLF